jgi:hypothetical protein
MLSEGCSFALEVFSEAFNVNSVTSSYIIHKA